MSNKSYLDTHALSTFQSILSSASASQKSEVRLTLSQARDLNNCISVLLLRYAQVQEQLIETQKNLIDANNVTVELKGQDF